MKKLLLLLFPLLLTGCTVKYELVINSGNIQENINIEVDEKYKEYIESYEYILTDLDQKNKTFYNFNYNKEKSILKYDYNYTFKSFASSGALKTCFTTYSVITEDDYYLIQTGAGFNCLPYQYSDYDYFDYDELVIQIKTNHVVISNNADKVENNTYFWYINEENKNNKTISFKISKDDIKPSTYFGIEFIMFVVGLISIGGIIALVVISKNKKNNKL